MESAISLDANASAHDTFAAVRNTVKLGGSLLATLGIAFGVRLLLPRYLGPDRSGELLFAESFTTAAFVVLGLGLDTYVRKEIPLRPAHGSDFWATLILVRVAFAVVLFGAISIVLAASHTPPEIRRLVYVYGLAQFFIVHNQSLSAFLHAHGTVDGLSIGNIFGKLLWGVGVLAVIFTHNPLVGFAYALLAAELVKTAVFTSLARKHLKLEVRWGWLAVRQVVWQSLPYYLNVVALTIYSKADVNMLKLMFHVNDREVGWYGAASNLAGLTLITTPLIGWVILPLFARAAARSEEEFSRVLCRSLEIVLAIAFPICLLVVVGADVWIRLIFGSAFAPAALPLKALAPTFLLTYVTCVCATALIRMDRPWMMTFISLGGLVLTPLLNYLFIPPSMRIFGPAGAGLGCAFAIVTTEAAVIAVQMCFIGRRAFDKRSLSMIVKTLAICATVLFVDSELRWMGPARIAVDAALYFGLATFSRALRLREMADFALNSFRSTRAAAL